MRQSFIQKGFFFFALDIIRLEQTEWEERDEWFKKKKKKKKATETHVKTSLVMFMSNLNLICIIVCTCIVYLYRLSWTRQVASLTFIDQATSS